MYAGHHDDLSGALRVGDNFAVNTKEKDSDFYILKCCTAKRMSTTNEKDAWHNRIKKKSWFVQGHFYERVKGHSDRYMLLNDKAPASLYSHLIRCLRFPLFPKEGEPNVYTMTDDVYEHIYNSMPSEDMPL
ncbi:hypothetical protein L7F22_047457 [Adiantum nelumboides]|nr:hypothetical protein [Adiantum nelumboides]